MLRITPEVRDEMFAHALAVAPLEACGMFSAAEHSDIVDAFHPVANAAQSPELFVLDGQEMLTTEQYVHEAGRWIVGVMHSHTQTSPYPSTTDVDASASFDPSGVFHHIIVSLRDAEPILRCYQIEQAVITEIPVVVVDDDFDEAGGEDPPIAAVMRLAPPTG